MEHCPTPIKLMFGINTEKMNICKENCIKNVNFQKLQSHALTNWCTHLYIMHQVGLGQWTDDKFALESRLSNIDTKFLVFFDLDETLTSNNDAPTKDKTQSQQMLQEYFKKRVPSDLLMRVKKLFDEISQRSDISCFILTDNIYAATKCTMKLAFDIELPDGSIIDRKIRAQDYNGMSKAQFLKHVIQLRKDSAVQIIFVDNDTRQREEVENVFNTVPTRQTFVCCQNLVTGLAESHIAQIKQFLQLR